MIAVPTLLEALPHMHAAVV